MVGPGQAFPEADGADADVADVMALSPSIKEALQWEQRVPSLAT